MSLLEEGISHKSDSHRSRPGEPLLSLLAVSHATLAALVPDLGDGAEAHAEAAGDEEEEDGRACRRDS